MAPTSSRTESRSDTGVTIDANVDLVTRFAKSRILEIENTER